MANRLERGVEISSFKSKNGVSLNELISQYVSKRGASGPRISPRIIWLSDALETEEFWYNLHLHLLNDTRKRKQSVGGAFYKERGKEKIGEYTFNELFTSLNNFLRRDSNRNAVEFLFRDFFPRKKNQKLLEKIQNTRDTAIDLFPRLRKLSWKEYKEALNTKAFWLGMHEDLSSINSPVATASFFQNKASIGKSDALNIKTQLERAMLSNFKQQVGEIEKRALFTDYRSMSQIVKDMFQENPRTFFLRYESNSSDPQLQKIIAQTKLLIEKKVLPVKSTPEKIRRITKKELRDIIQSKEFWQNLSRDFDRHITSGNPAYSLSYFLRHYDAKENEIFSGRIGTYAYLVTPFISNEEGPTRMRIKKPSEELVMELMWGFKPEENIEELVLDVKRKASELFLQDCLYVEIQTPEFRKRIEDDVDRVEKEVSFLMFLRYFNRKNNTNADRRLHKPNNALYQHFLHRAYHEPEELRLLCKFLDFPTSNDYKENLQTLFYRHSSDRFKKLLRLKFPVNFDREAKQNKQKEVAIFDRTKHLLIPLQNDSTCIVKVTDSTQNIDKLRQKVETAARSLKLRINTSIENGTTIVIAARTRKKLNKVEMEEAEIRVKELRKQGLSNKEITKKLGMEKDYNVEYIVTRLIKKGELDARCKRT